MRSAGLFSREFGLTLPTIEIASDEPVYPANRDAEFSCEIDSSFASKVVPNDFLVTAFFFRDHIRYWRNCFFYTAIKLRQHSPDSQRHRGGGYVPNASREHITTHTRMGRGDSWSTLKLPTRKSRN